MVNINTTPELLSAAEVLPILRSGQLSVEEYARALLARIEERDPKVHAWVFLDVEQVLRDARALDRLPESERGPLYGLAIAVKDVMHVKGMPTRYNSPIYEVDDTVAEGDATCVRMLRGAGALILGKTRTTEFAVTNVGTVCVNPHSKPGELRSPGGSSSGSAAAVADFQCPIALGTQTGGSIIRPGSFNGVYAFKPTWNAVSREGLKIHSLTCDTFGLFARSIDDIEIMADLFQLADISPVATPQSLAGMRFALCRTPDWSAAEPSTVNALNLGAALLRKHGAIVVDLELPASFTSVSKWHARIMSGEGRSSFLSYVKHNRHQVHPSIVGFVEESNPAANRKALLEAYDGCAGLRPVIDEIASQYTAILCPSTPGEALVGLKSTGSYIFNAIWTVLHVPVINVPGFVGETGMPVGLSLVTGRFRDRHLLKVAREVGAVFEKEGGFHSNIL